MFTIVLQMPFNFINVFSTTIKSVRFTLSQLRIYTNFAPKIIEIAMSTNKAKKIGRTHKHNQTTDLKCFISRKQLENAYIHLLSEMETFSSKFN
jgi:hypothetical protein